MPSSTLFKLVSVSVFCLTSKQYLSINESYLFKNKIFLNEIFKKEIKGKIEILFGIGLYFKDEIFIFLDYFQLSKSLANSRLP